MATEERTTAAIRKSVRVSRRLEEAFRRSRGEAHAAPPPGRPQLAARAKHSSSTKPQPLS